METILIHIIIESQLSQKSLEIRIVFRLIYKQVKQMIFPKNCQYSLVQLTILQFKHIETACLYPLHRLLVPQWRLSHQPIIVAADIVMDFGLLLEGFIFFWNFVEKFHPPLLLLGFFFTCILLFMTLSSSFSNWVLFLFLCFLSFLLLFFLLTWIIVFLFLEIFFVKILVSGS